MKEELLRYSVLPPIIGVVIRIGRGNHTHFKPQRKHVLTKHVRPPAVIIRRDDQHFLPILPDCQLFDNDQFIKRVSRAMRQLDDVLSRHAALRQVALRKFCRARVRPQKFSARHHRRRHARLKQFRCALRPVCLIVVASQDNNRIRTLRRLIHNPDSPCQPQQWVPHNVEHQNETRQKQQKNKLADDSAALGGRGPAHRANNPSRRYFHCTHKRLVAEQVAQKSTNTVIPSEARDPSWFECWQKEEFLVAALLGMTAILTSSRASKPATTVRD